MMWHTKIENNNIENNVENILDAEENSENTPFHNKVWNISSRNLTDSERKWLELGGKFAL